MNNSSTKEKLAAFKSLHQLDEPLILPNAWDVTSAKMMEKLGFAAIGTTSMGIANSLGFKDGAHRHFDEVLFMIKRIADSIQLPLTVDIESGYDDVAYVVKKLLEVGVVGINIEDSFDDQLISTTTFKHSIEEIREVLNSEDSDMFINGRTDVLWLGLEDESLLNERVALYSDLMVDCVFVPGLKDVKLIHQMSAYNKPLNILIHKEISISSLHNTAVKRISFGSSLFRFAHHSYKELLLHFEERKDELFDGMTYKEMNRLFES